MSWSNEIADVDLLKKTFDGLDTSVNKNVTDLMKLIKVYEDLSKASQNVEATAENLGKAQKAALDVQKQKEAVDKQIITTTTKVNQVEKDTIEVMIKKRLTTAEATKEITLQTKAELASVGSKQKLIAETAILENQLNKVNLTTKEGVKEAERLRAEIDKNNVSIKENSSALGAQKINIGNYKSAFNGLIDQFKAGEIGAGGLVKGVLSIGKAFIIAIVTNPVLLTIAAITGAVYALWKAFSKSDEFMNVVNGGFKALGNVIDILSDRLMSFFKMMGSIMTLDWKGMKENGKAAFEGIGKAINDAAKAGYNYVQVMDDIEDREAASLIRAAKLRAEIEELKNVSKDQMKSSKERQDAAQLAYNKEIELFKLEKQFAGEKTTAENNNLASKIQNNALSLKDKQEQLKKWLQFDDTEINAAQEKDAAFREFYDKNEADFKNVQKMMADEIMQRAGFNQETRRLLTGLSGFKKELRDEEKNKTLANLDLTNVREKQIILDSKNTTEQKTKDLVKLEIDFINKKQALYAKDSKEWAAFEGEKQNISIKAREDILKDIKTHFGLENSATRAAQKESDDAAEERLKGGLKSNQDYLDAQLIQAKDEAKSEDDLEKAKADKKKKIQEAAIDLAFATMNAVFDINANKLSAELSDLEKKKDKELSNKNLTEAQKANIEAQYLKKENAIKTKQAENDKKQALFNIAMNTAVAAVKGLGEGGPLLMAIYIALGLVQAAVVMAKPLPKYAKGTMNAEREGIFGEAGLEVMFPKGGGAIFADKPTYFEGDRFKGAQIKNSDETKRLVGMVSDRNIVVKNQTDDRLLNKMDELKSAIINKKEWIMDSDHRIIGQKTSNHQEVYLNRLINRN